MRYALRISPVLRPLFTVLGAGSGASFLELDSEAGSLRVKMGIWFDETFSLSEILEVEPGTWPWWGGLGVKLGPRNSVGVVGTSEGVVAIHFKQPQRMRVLFTVNRPRLLVSPDDPEGFLRELRAALA